MIWVSEPKTMVVLHGNEVATCRGQSPPLGRKLRGAFFWLLHLFEDLVAPA